MNWQGWGDQDKARTLPEPIAVLLRELFDVHETPAVPLAEVRLPPPALPVEVRARLAAIVGERHLRDDQETRVRHTRGKSTPDLLRIRAGDATAAPDAVLTPGGPEEVLDLLAACAAERVAVAPYGGGTSVVGGLAPERTGFTGLVALDLTRLDRLLAVDAESMIATVQPGLRVPEAERLLAGYGLTLGHFPQSYEYATLGGAAATRSSGQASAGYGRFDDMVVGLRVATPQGPLDLGRAPKSAAGPDLRQLVLGSEGAFGVITELRLRVRPRPERQAYEGWRFPSFTAGTAALRALAQHGPLPAVLRLSDETETLLGLAEPDTVGETAVHEDGSREDAGDQGARGCLAILGWEPAAPAVAGAVLAAHGGVPLGAEPGTAWARGRFAAPYLRDALLAAGVTVETVETAGFWANLPRLYDTVRLALLAALGTPLVMCHISHVYQTGASLYFTVVTDAGLTGWERAKREVSAAIVAAGGTISHHHGVGRDHRDAYAAEIGPLGVEILRAVKKRLDPAGVLNPGVLIP